jgi:hypothetical protein
MPPALCVAPYALNLFGWQSHLIFPNTAGGPGLLGSNKSLELKFALNRNGPNWCQNLELEFGKKFLTKKY